MNGVGAEITDAAKAIGLFGPEGSLSASWFDSPLAGLKGILTVPAQRQALFDLLDQLFAPANPLGAAPNEKWHPLLGTQTNGNLYLTVANGSGPTTVGIAGDVHSTSSSLPASLRARLSVVSLTDAGVSAIAGTSDGAFELEVRVELNWSVAAGQAIGLQAIRATATLTPLSTPV